MPVFMRFGIRTLSIVWVDFTAVHGKVMCCIRIPLPLYCTRCKIAIGKDMSNEVTGDAVEGMRARKRRQSRERITNVAIPLFLKQGYEATTVDEIVAAADISKRTFFDYFATKEDVVFAWQDDFGIALAAAVRARPAKEPLAVTAKEALVEAVIIPAQHPQMESVVRLISKTPLLQARDNLKYIKLEQTFSEALMERMHDEAGYFRARLLSTIIMGGVRMAPESWRVTTNDKDVARLFIKKVMQTIWAELREFSRMKPVPRK